MTKPIPDFLPYGNHTIDQEDIDTVVQALRASKISGGQSVEAFEKALAEKVQARFAVCCSSGTAALHLAVAAAGLKAGDWAIVPTVTFIATANACRYVGADVAFADVDGETGALTAPAVHEPAARIPGGTVKAVLPVHLNGHPMDLPAIRQAADDLGAVVIEDACQALGAELTGESGAADPIGSCRHSDMAVFSFHPVKSITTGEGGAVTTNSEDLYRRLVNLRSHGMNKGAAAFENTEAALDPAGEPNPWYYECAELGFNYRISDFNCALGLAQLGKLDGFVARRRELAALYDEKLSTLADWAVPVRPRPETGSAYHLYAVKINFQRAGLERASVMRRLIEYGIGTQVHFIPVHRQPYYERLYGGHALPGAEDYYESVLSLPLFPAMTEGDVERVVKALEQLG